MLPRPLTNFELQLYFQKERKFIDVYSGNNMPFAPTYATAIRRDGTYAINFEEYTNIETPLAAIYIKIKPNNTFDGFENAHIPKNITKFIGNKIIKLEDPNVNKNQFGSFLGHPCYLRSRVIFFVLILC